MVDFRKELTSKDEERITNPIDLYYTLDRKSIAGPLRPVQEQVLNEWYKKRLNDKDLIIKLHTGEGKTLIGLLILQSTIYRGKGPCMYVCPNIYLKKQVELEAKKFGIQFCTLDDNNMMPNDFESGKKILITTAQKLFNGLTIFGLDNRHIEVGTIILDDSHACIDVLKNAYTINIEKSKLENLYTNLLNIFTEDLIDQGEGSFCDIQDGEQSTIMPVPYWAWNNKKTEVLKLLRQESSRDELKFCWPLIKDNIHDFICLISGTKIEIAPYNTTVTRFGTFSSARQRILMSATTQEDSFFLKGLEFSCTAVSNPITSKNEKWSGEKMILLPSLINEECTRELVAKKIASFNNKSFGSVVIVSNTKRARYYESLGAIFPKDNSEIFNVINGLKTNSIDETVVLNNRYDGIDLPDESCRLLVLDSLPYLKRYYDIYEERCCPRSEIINKKIAQKIEQGMGRAVRGEKDFCGILIIGPDIERYLMSEKTRGFLSLQTQKQIEIGFKAANLAKKEVSEEDPPMKQISLLLNQMMERDEGWKAYYTSEMDSIEETIQANKYYERCEAEAKIEKLYSKGKYREATKEIQNYIDAFIDNELEKGWYLENNARITCMWSSVESERLQRSAFSKNSQLLKPKGGLEYSKVSFLNGTRLVGIRKYLDKFENIESFNLHLNEMLENFAFGITAEKFENALNNIGLMLGYTCERPDKKIRKGPDNLWCDYNNDYVFFECKNEVEESRNEIYKSEVGQFNNHCGWFQNEYGEQTTVLRVIIIPTRKICYEADFTHEVFVMRKNGLQKFKRNIKNFFNEIIRYKKSTISDETLQELINNNKLNISDFNNYIEEIQKCKR